MTRIRKIRKREYKLKRFIAAHRYENVPYLWREFLYFVFIVPTGLVRTEAQHPRVSCRNLTTYKRMEKKVLLFIYFFFAVFFPVVYKIVPPQLATASFSIPDLFSVAHDRGREKLWGSTEQVSLNIPPLSEKQSKRF